MRRSSTLGTNPWSTHNRFVISHSLLRRPEYRDALLHHLGERARKGLLIVDEAHVAAPASASKYATDTDITRTIRDLAPRFDNRLFLSATPHNGHSNSFSALLEILDPVRFTRGVPVEGRKDLEPIMTRRLKRDLRQLGVESFPRRMLVQLTLRSEGGVWTLESTPYDAETGKQGVPVVADLGRAEPYELLLSQKLERYTELCAPTSGQGRLPFIHLQQRLLSSPEAFARTLEAHAQGLAKKGGPVAVEQRQLALPTKDALDAGADPEVREEHRHFLTPLLLVCLALADQHDQSLRRLHHIGDIQGDQLRSPKRGTPSQRQQRSIAQAEQAGRRRYAEQPPEQVIVKGPLLLRSDAQLALEGGAHVRDEGVCPRRRVARPNICRADRGEGALDGRVCVTLVGERAQVETDRCGR